LSEGIWATTLSISSEVKGLGRFLKASQWREIMREIKVLQDGNRYTKSFLIHAIEGLPFLDDQQPRIYLFLQEKQLIFSYI
jgi:hypothetical protein